MPKFTFLLPAYKKDFLGEALSGIKHQTYQDFKVLVSDDCSPYDLKTIFEEAVGDDSRFEYRRNEKNIGGTSLVAHWNQLVDLCDTEFLIMASDDDIYAPDFLKEIEGLSRKWSDVDIYRARARKINDMTETIAEDFPSPEHESQIDFLYDWFCLRKVSCIANYVFRTSALRGIGGFVDFPLAWGSDEATVLLLSSHGACTTPSVNFSFRLSGQNISTRTEKNIMHTKMQARLMYIDFLKLYFAAFAVGDNALSLRRYREFKSDYMDSLYTQLRDDAVHLCWSDAYQCFRHLKKDKRLSGFLEKLHYIWAWLKIRIR